MVKVLMFAAGPFVPVREGTDRFIYDVARFLNAQSDLELTLVIRDDQGRVAAADYAGICRHVEKIQPGHALFRYLNLLAARCGVSVFEGLGFALGMRKRFRTLAECADVVILNYAIWFPLLCASFRRRKVICNTLDLTYYRRASMRGTETKLKRLAVWLSKFFELRVLRSFRKITVLGEYEKQMLEGSGFPSGQVLQVGMPIEGRILTADPVKREFDFLLIGAKDQVNVDAALDFFAKVVPLLGGRTYRMALVGSVCNNSIWDKPEIVPANIDLVRLGFVDRMEDAIARARIGVSTVPRGSGIKVKSVEMILRGLPLVTTDHGIEGIPATTEGIINIDRASDDEIRERLTSWLSDPLEAARVGRDQAEKVAMAFAPETALAGLLQSIREMASK